MSDNGKPNGRAVYAVSRGKTLEDALVTFRGLFNVEPVAVAVNVTLVDETSVAVIGAGLDVPVVTNGGANLGELWLQCPAVDVQAAATLRPHSLISRCDRARREAEPMTPERARQMALALEIELSEVERE